MLKVTYIETDHSRLDQTLRASAWFELALSSAAAARAGQR